MAGLRGRTREQTTWLRIRMRILIDVDALKKNEFLERSAEGARKGIHTYCVETNVGSRLL